ncbi:hypothetical protein [Agrobacterium fabrum]|uniref:hypothetical protein n=1 Tax=Agrobacterium fabrum TaxID=1176649 RepID=UPI000EF5310B|nr:hypothetical protein [Agrobacterium fabrum]AYM57298.1 hypothetical protein At1D132_12810 [Agrobacterium fabrum]NSZ11657.1 hypothetical protein [Agrobacterium fabrum]
MFTVSVPLFIAAILVLFIVGIKCARFMNFWDVVRAPEREATVVQNYLDEGDAYIRALKSQAQETAK